MKDVVLTGNIENPFGVLSDCNCFVLPSYYEGQPMVILEARTLGLSIIESDFDTVNGSSSGTIYGASSGVTLSVIRVLFYYLTGRDLTSDEISI